MNEFLSECKVCHALAAAGLSLLVILGMDMGVFVCLSSSRHPPLMKPLLCNLLVVFLVLTAMLASADPLAVNYTSLGHRQQNNEISGHVNIDCGSDKGVCSGVHLSYRCDVAGDLLVWEVGPKLLDITFSQFDKIGENVTLFDIDATVLNVTKRPPHLSSDIQFFASEKYNNTKFYCADGVTGETSSDFCSPRLISTPGLVVNLMGHQKEDALELSWDAARTPEANIMYYTIQVNPVPGGGTCATGVCNTTDNKFTITKLKDCVNYDITVQAVNCGGVGNTTFWSIHYDIPDAVQNLKTFNEDSNSIHVKWDAPQNTRRDWWYIVSVEPGPQTGSCPGGECIVANTSFFLTGLEPCQAYMVDVKALNCLDIGPSVSAQATTDAGLNFGVMSSHKVVMSCNDTLDVYYEWAGCSNLNVTFLVVFTDEKNSLSQNYEKTMFLQHGMKGNLSLPISFNLEDKAEYFFSIGAYNLSKPLTDVKIGYLSSTRKCANGQDVGISEKIPWKLSFIITTSVLGVLCFITVLTTVLLIISLCYKRRSRQENQTEAVIQQEENE